jgi:hypothetical protein
MAAFAASYPFVFKSSEGNGSDQERLKGLVQLSAGTTFQDFQQQLAQRIGLLPGQLQVVIACSRANEFDQLQKIPIHEGTNFNVILTQHNPARDKNVHFIVQPKMTAKDRQLIAQRKAMEAARADEEAAARMAASSHSGSPRFHTPPDGPSILAHLAHSGALNGKLSAGLLPQYNLQAYNSNMVLVPHSNGWTPPGTAPQQTVYKNAVAGGLNGGMLPHMLQPQRQATHSPDENRAPIFASNVSLTGPGTIATPRVTPFPEGMLRRVHEEHSGSGEGEFWRTSPRDRMVMGFRGPSPFGPIGTKIRAA